MVKPRPEPAHAYFARWRNLRGYSQQKLADLLGMPLHTLGRWERGETPMTEDELARVADALDVTVHQLRHPPEEADLIARLDQLDSVTHPLASETDDNDFKTILNFLALLIKRRAE